MYISAGMVSSPGALPPDSCLIAFDTYASEGEASKLEFSLTWGKRAIALSLIAAGQFSTLLKCSAHLSRIRSFSVIIWVSSAFRREQGLVCLGPYMTCRAW